MKESETLSNEDQRGVKQYRHPLQALLSGDLHIAPPVKAAPGDRNAVKLAIARENLPPCKCRRTTEQIRTSVASGSAKKVKKAAEKAEVARLKASTKEAKGLAKAAEATTAVEMCFLLREAASLELLGFVKILKEEHHRLVKNPGFVEFSKFFVQNNKQNKAFLLLEKLKNNTLLRQYCALITTWRLSSDDLSENLFIMTCPCGSVQQQQVRDFVDTSGNGSLLKGPKSARKYSKTLASRPALVGGSVPHRCGQIEEAPKTEDEMGGNLMLLIHRQSEKSAALEREDQNCAEDMRVEEQRENQAQVDLMEQARLDQLRQARVDAENTQIQVQLEQEAEALQQCSKEAERQAIKCNEDRKQEQEEACQICLDET
ncbi:hypothetical protein VP01_585g3 [Puccinia sorghi]|uniref:Uncharacterized protein n=1 Tax=Puccinia sorghi TaxID=27349 RepID=A0A0L6UHY4_9BASI|nr:hypothetical protein VP01_585g3 [Puccinia sorghi]